MSNRQTTVAGITVWVFLWFVWKAGYGAGYQDRTHETEDVEKEEEDNGGPNK